MLEKQQAWAGFLWKKIMLLLLLISLYIYIYNPPFAFLPLSASKFLYIFLFPYFILNKQIRRKFFWLFTFEFFILLVIIVYSLGTCILNAVSDRTFFYVGIFILFEHFFFAFSIAYFLNKYYKGSIDTILLTVTTLASLITLFLIMNPELNFLVKQFVLLPDETALKMDFRCFGVSESLTFAYAIVQGIAASLCLEKCKNTPLMIILFALYLISITFNARIGFMPILFLLFYMAFFEKRFSRMLKTFAILGGLIIIFLSTDMAADYEKTIEWAGDFFEEILGTLSGNKDMTSANMDVLLNDMIVLPNSAGDWLFGTGENVFSSSIRNSDIGYLIQLNFGGLFYILLFCLLIGSLCYKYLKYVRTDRWFIFLFITSILVCSYKGLLLSSNAGFKMLMLLYFIYFIRANYTYFFVDSKKIEC